MDLLAPKCVRCGRRSPHRFENRPTCEPCLQQIELMLDGGEAETVQHR